MKVDIPDYTKEEREKIDSGMWNYSCPNGHFWLRDYPFPVRHCPACGEIKPWADKKLVRS